MRPPRPKHFALFFLSVVALGCCYLSVEHLRNFSKERLVAAIYDRALGIFLFSAVWALFKNTIFTLSFWGVIIFTLCLQRVIPAKPVQNLFSLSFGQDLVWSFYE